MNKFQIGFLHFQVAITKIKRPSRSSPERGVPHQCKHCVRATGVLELFIILEDRAGGVPRYFLVTRSIGLSNIRYQINEPTVNEFDLLTPEKECTETRELLANGGLRDIIHAPRLESEQDATIDISH
jgi:hypothetical protein